jgi:hypothetical protein
MLVIGDLSGSRRKILNEKLMRWSDRNPTTYVHDGGSNSVGVRTRYRKPIEYMGLECID